MNLSPDAISSVHFVFKLDALTIIMFAVGRAIIESVVVNNLNMLE